MELRDRLDASDNEINNCDEAIGGEDSLLNRRRFNVILERNDAELPLNRAHLRILRHRKIINYANLLVSLLTAIVIIILCAQLHQRPTNILVSATDLDDISPPSSSPPISADSKTIPDPCEICNILVKSFTKGLDATSRGKHEGGDTSWEERNLKNYADSEVRLVEIQEQLCEDVTIDKGKPQCLSLAEDTEGDVEDWWFNQRKKNVRLYDYLCISKLKRCCPEGTYGPNCQKCPENHCNGHGDCDGSGTRLGTGQCNCHFGYSGEECQQCSEDYFRVATNSNEEDHFTCLKCDFSCQGCHGPGPMNCTECRSGYHYQDKEGCVDINECDVGINANGDTRLCKGNTYCVNTDGYYKCAECHEACSGCLAYGPNKCLSCARGYHLDSERYCRTEEEMERLEELREDEAWSEKKVMLGKVLYNLGNIVSIGILTFNVTFRNVPVYMVCIYGIIIGIILNAPFFFLTDDDIPSPEHTRISSE